MGKLHATVKEFPGSQGFGQTLQVVAVPVTIEAALWVPVLSAFQELDELRVGSIDLIASRELVNTSRLQAQAHRIDRAG